MVPVDVMIASVHLSYCLFMETGTLEEHHDSLIRSHAQLKLDLNRVRAQLRNQRQMNQEAQAAEQLSQRRMASDEALNVHSKYAWVTVSHKIATGNLSPFSSLIQLSSREQESEAASVESAQLVPPANESTLVQSSLYQAVLEKGL